MANCILSMAHVQSWEAIAALQLVLSACWKACVWSQGGKTGELEKRRNEGRNEGQKETVVFSAQCLWRSWYSKAWVIKLGQVYKKISNTRERERQTGSDHKPTQTSAVSPDISSSTRWLILVCEPWYRGVQWILISCWFEEIQDRDIWNYFLAAQLFLANCISPQMDSDLIASQTSLCSPGLPVFWYEM